MSFKSATVAESIEVIASGALLSSENATVDTVIEDKRTVELPLNDRNHLQLVSLAPNVSFGFPSAGQAGSRQGGIRADQRTAVGGMRAQYNRYTMDDVENTDPNFNTFVVFPSVDALQEFKVQSGAYPAEFGRSAIQINVFTRSGGNDFHGTAFYFLRNEVLDAKNCTGSGRIIRTGPSSWSTRSGSGSGAPPRASTTWPPLRSREAASLRGLSTRREFSTPRRAPMGADGKVSGAERFANAMIPANRIDATSKQLLEFYRTPNVAGAGLSSNYVQANGAPINRDQFIGRFDFVETSNSQWSGRHSWGDEDQRSQRVNLNGAAVLTNFKQIMVSNTRVLSPSVVLN